MIAIAVGGIQRLVLRSKTSYESTNKNCQAGDIEMVEYGHPKDDKGFPVFNYSIAYDTENKEPLFYEQYPGSVVDISQLQFMLEKAMGYGYKKVGFSSTEDILAKKISSTWTAAVMILSSWSKECLPL